MENKIIRRQTIQRKIILEELKKTKSHPTAAVLFKIVRKRLPTISFGTVYRNLNLLKDEGKILELAYDKYSSRYDGNAKNHYHFVCLKCEKIFDIDEAKLEELDKRISKKTGMNTEYHTINFYGYCKGCKS